MCGDCDAVAEFAYPGEDAKYQFMKASDLIAPITGRNETIRLPDASHWMQGRTMYGGASALAAYTHAVRAFPDLPPLRAAQVAFVAPVGEDLRFDVQVIRRGRNVAQIRSDLYCDDTLALSAFLLFGAGREPNAVHPADRPDPFPELPGPEETLPVPEGPHFIANYELRRAQEQRGKGPPIVSRWFRLRDEDGLDPVSRLILIGDTMPPGAIRAMKRKGPISSMNWSFNVLDPEIVSPDGWWLAETVTEQADAGYSSERLRLWNSNGDQALAGMQSAAIFG